MMIMIKMMMMMYIEKPNNGRVSDLVTSQDNVLYTPNTGKHYDDDDDDDDVVVVFYENDYYYYYGRFCFVAC